MSYLNARFLGLVLAATGILNLPAVAPAAVLGPHADACVGGEDRPALLVRVEGMHGRAGTIRVQTYGGDPASYFEKGAYLDRLDVAPPPSGPVEVCMPVPKAGNYAVLVKHDLGGGTFGLNNGGGFSGNPPVSMVDLMMKRKPSPAQVQVSVKGLTRVPVTLRYLQGAQ